MFSFRKSLGALAGLSLVVGLVMLFIPTSTQGQGGNQQPLNVSVVNTATRPVYVRDVDNPARQPFHVELYDFRMIAGDTLSTDSFIVPAGKRLVIEQVSGRFTAPAGQTLDLVVQTGPSEAPATHYYLPVRQGPLAPLSGDGFVLNQLSRQYAEPGSNVGVILQRRGGTDGEASGLMTFTGYLVDVP